jgi:DNA-binding NarL/FixJ family response regulator
MIRVLLADDHTIVRDGLKRILSGLPDITVAGEAVDGTQVMQHVRQGGFDVLVTDLSMPGRSGVELIKQIRTEAPKLPILVLTMHQEEQYAVRAIRAGANGYLTKDSAGTDLVEALRKVASGRLHVSQRVAELLAYDVMPASDELPHKSLSDREYQVFQLLIDGKSVSDIADRLCLSVKTVSTHKTHVLQKIGVTSLADLVRYALKHGLSASESRTS